ncbi:protein kinase [bacterium]|nr:protein kinase [bacterium]
MVSSLPSGTFLGPYEILSQIGAGGMGEVYRAKDTRLDRLVAIKILPVHLSANSTLKQRFEREARTVSSLNHPHICTVHDIGRQNEIDYLVMEFIEGETLQSRLVRGPLSTSELLKYSIHIADALDKAHRHGVIHRDLKPGNIMLTKSGAKLLDFGLARKEAPLIRQTGDSALPTASQPLTAEGTILGTLAYMAPEQLQGKEADARTDIFAFGALLYEMATGKRAFEGNSQVNLISAILRDEPAAISTIQHMSPPALYRVVRTCLAKDPEDRWQTAHDLQLELKWMADAGSQTGALAPATTDRRNWNVAAWVTAGIFLIASLVFAIAYFRVSDQEKLPVRFTIMRTVSTDAHEQTETSDMLAVSPDGRMLAFIAAASEGKNSSIWIRHMDSVALHELGGTEGASFPFWSPDNRSIGFFADRKLKIIDISGGSPQVLSDVSIAGGGSWSPSGVILFAPDFGAGLYNIPVTGGVSKPITTLDVPRGETSHRFPHFLPDGRRFLYYVYSGKAETQGIFLGSLDSKERNFLLTASGKAEYAAPGYLFYVQSASLICRRFDSKKLELSGELVRVAENVGQYAWAGPTGYANFSVSQNGVIAFSPITLISRQLKWFDRNGKDLGAIGPPGAYYEPDLSPDGKRVAVWIQDSKIGAADIYLIETARGVVSRFTFDDADDNVPTWSPDGTRIVFSSNKEGQEDLYQKLASGAGEKELLFKSNVAKWVDDWSPDGRWIVFENTDPKTKMDLYLLAATGNQKPVPFLQTPFNESHAQISPDGKWIAYVSDESGEAQVYIQSFPTPGSKWQISTDGGDMPNWRGDSKELFYISPKFKLMSVELVSGSTFAPSVPVELFETLVPSISLISYRNHYVVHPDGQRFLINQVVENRTSSPITVLLNWTAERVDQR